MIPEVFRPGRKHCYVVLMTELPDLDILAVGGLQSFAGVDQPFSVFRSPRHSRPIPDLVALQFQQLIVQSIANHVDPVATLGYKITGHHGELEWEECRVVQEQPQCALGLRDGQE